MGHAGRFPIRPRPPPATATRRRPRPRHPLTQLLTRQRRRHATAQDRDMAQAARMTGHTEPTTGATVTSQTRPNIATARPPQADRRKPDRPGLQRANPEGTNRATALDPDSHKPARSPQQSHHSRTAQTPGATGHVGGKGGLRIEKQAKHFTGDKRSGIPTRTREVHNAAPGSPLGAPVYRSVTVGSQLHSRKSASKVCDIAQWEGRGSSSRAWERSQADRLSAMCRGVVLLLPVRQSRSKTGCQSRSPQTGGPRR